MNMSLEHLCRTHAGTCETKMRDTSGCPDALVLGQNMENDFSLQTYLKQSLHGTLLIDRTWLRKHEYIHTTIE